VPGCRRPPDIHSSNFIIRSARQNGPANMPIQAPGPDEAGHGSVDKELTKANLVILSKVEGPSGTGMTEFTRREMTLICHAAVLQLMIPFP